MPGQPRNDSLGNTRLVSLFLKSQILDYKESTTKINSSLRTTSTSANQPKVGRYLGMQWKGRGNAKSMNTTRPQTVSRAPAAQPRTCRRRQAGAGTHRSRLGQRSVAGHLPPRRGAPSSRGDIQEPYSPPVQPRGSTQPTPAFPPPGSAPSRENRGP